TINATALGGTLMYSINGGGSYQGSSVFTSVSPGTYNIVVLAQGTGCQETGTATVDPGGSGSTWYKDLDGDGYTDGITTTACTAPAGYVASALPGDCDDNNASVNPGAPELCNGLDDNCDGIIPASEQDNDGDGYRLCDGDCNDNNAAINPGAAEVCNGIDDNCNGQIDEGNPPANQVHVGNVILTSQAAVNNFSQCIYKIQGSLTIQGTGINSLANLSNLQEVTGNITIQITSLPNLSGLDGLTTIGGTLTIKLNNYGAKLTSLTGLGSLTSIGQNLFVYFNFSLSDCCSIDDLLSNAGVGGVTSIHHNAAGCQSVADIGNSCSGGNIVVDPGGGIAWAEQAEKPRMSLFPNPASSEVTILLEGLPSGGGELRIYDPLGRSVYSRSFSEGQTSQLLELDKGRFPPGVYSVTMFAGGERLVERLIVQ
ncbi:MAG: T9SS C-terminal target domain-containing protein, partial [Bacteroidetes bacterium]